MTLSKQPYENLLVWKKADEFVMQVYAVTKNFPKDELYGVVSQLRRASLSIALNIVEGAARKSSKEYLRFLYIARGSLAESAYLLDVSCRLGYVTKDVFLSLESWRKETSYLLQRLIASL